MITQPSTTVTINTSEQRRANNRVLLNAMKPETRQLVKGFKKKHESGNRIAKALGNTIGVELSSKDPFQQRGSTLRRQAAKLEKFHKKKQGSKARRDFAKGFADD